MQLADVDEGGMYYETTVLQLRLRGCQHRHVALISRLKAERQNACMSKITNDCLTGFGTGCFIYNCTRMATVGVKGLRSVHLQ